MSNNEDNSSSNSPGENSVPEQPNIQDLVHGLDFVPTWARKPNDGSTVHAGRSAFEDHTSGRDRRGRRDGRPATGSRGGGGGDGNRRPQQGRPDNPRGGRPQKVHAGGGRKDQRRSQSYAPERVHLPIEVSFIPDRDRLGAVVRQLHAVKRAFPLTYIAGLFLTKPEYHMIKLEAKTGKNAEPIHFYQCRKTKVVFLSNEQLQEYLVRTQLENHFKREEVAVEPPSGNFICVGQCKRSGKLLGPPNFHGYNERLMEFYRAHGASSMSLDQYRNAIEMVRDPAVIEKWKEEYRTQVRYRPIESAPDAEAVLTLAQAESIFMEKYIGAYITTGTKVILPAVLVNRLEDNRLSTHLQFAWQRECRFPFSLMLALRPAFRRMRLSLFKAGKDENYVTAIPPKPLDAEHAIPSIKEMMALINDHPGWSKKQLIEKLYPGKTENDPEVVEKLSPLTWLVEKGHIIEFFNGTYATPGHLRKPEAIPVEAPQAHHHPEPEPNADSAIADVAPGGKNNAAVTDSSHDSGGDAADHPAND